MKKTTRMLSLLMALALVLALAACGGTSASESAPASDESTVSAPVEETPAEPEEPAVEEPPAEEEPAPEASSEEPEEPEEPAVVIEYPLFDEIQTYTVWMGSAPDLSEVVSEMNQFVVFRELEKITNVSWDATMVSFLAESEKFQLMVSSEDYRDVVVKAVDNYTGTVDQAIEEEFLIDIAPYIEGNMPNLSGWFEQYPDLRKQITTEAGAIGAFPKIYKEPSDVASGPAIRADWLEDLNLENPKTYDELHDVLTAFKSEKGAEKPLVIVQSTGVQADLLNGYNIGGEFYQVDGEIRFGAIQPEFKEYLTMMNQWLSEGLIDDLYQTNQYESLMDWTPITTGTCGVWCGTAAQTFTNILDMSADPNMRITGLTNVTKDGSVAHLGEEGEMFDTQMWSITTVCDEPEVICQYIDYIYSDAGILLANYGVEGETFTYVDGVPTLTDLVLNNPDYSYGAALNIFVCDRMTPAPFVIDEDRVRANYVQDQLDAIEVWNAATDGLYNLPRSGLSLTIEESQEYNRIYSDIETYMDEHIARFVNGDESLDNFDTFVETLIGMGIEDCIAIEQAAYDRYVES